MIPRVTRNTMASLLWTVLASCGGEQADDTTDLDVTPVAAIPAPPPSDAALAEAGAAVFTNRACNACHTMGGGRLVGPDLAGVTERREYGWIVAMIMNPDSMIRADTTAKRLFAEYMTPMANQGLSRRDADALYQFLVQNDTR